MSGTVILVGGAVFFLAAYFTYGRYLARLLGVDPARATPARTRQDGVDYVPTRLPVLFGHHFASIAGAGPIVGPVMAAYFGWAPVVLWILIGCVLIGAVHDVAALFVSVRNDGRSIGHVIEKQVGYVGRQIFLLFAWAALILVVAMFALLVAGTFVKTPAVATSSLIFIALAPICGYLVYRRGMPVSVATAIFVPLVFAGILVGTACPLDLVALGLAKETARLVWLAVLFGYVFVASTIPVWLLLQPRDYLNSYLLYAMILVGFLGIVVAGPRLELPAFEGWYAANPAGHTHTLVPILFVTVACGACSGFHALVSSGTTAKQIGSERHIQPVGYGSMLVEGLLALMALISVGVLVRGEYTAQVSAGGAVSTFAGGLASFVGSLGLSEQVGETFFALAICAFMLTTLDTATRLTRFAWQELFLPARGTGEREGGDLTRYLANRYTATLVAVGLAGYLAMSGNGQRIWPVFGASNQLLAALTLLAVTLVLVRRRVNFWVTLVPMTVMMVICVWALIELLETNWTAEHRDWALIATIIFLLAMALVLAVQAAVSVVRQRRGAPDLREAEAAE